MCDFITILEKFLEFANNSNKTHRTSYICSILIHPTGSLRYKNLSRIENSFSCFICNFAENLILK